MEYRPSEARLGGAGPLAALAAAFNPSPLTPPGAIEGPSLRSGQADAKRPLARRGCCFAHLVNCHRNSGASYTHAWNDSGSGGGFSGNLGHAGSSKLEAQVAWTDTVIYDCKKG